MGVNKIRYSIIIPHKNIPHLLTRCIETIPERDDVQIIIVDDNSDPKIVDFSSFPGLNKPNTEVYFTKEGKGAGYARNIGLTKTKGKWIVFADADDFFNKSFNSILDKYADVSADLVYFTSNSVDSDTLEPVKSRGSSYNELLKSASSKNIISDYIRYNINSPYAKFFSQSIVFKNNIKFDETFAANDVMFSTKNGHYSNNILIDLTEIYCATKRSDSLDSCYSYNHAKSRFDVSLNHYNFLKGIGKTKLSRGIWPYIEQVKKSGRKTWFKETVQPAFKIMTTKDFIYDFLRHIYIKINY